MIREGYCVAVSSLHVTSPGCCAGEQRGREQACPVPFDEGRLWKGEDGRGAEGAAAGHFHNITKVMDCVGCEKCKLWGKLQLLGE